MKKTCSEHVIAAYVCMSGISEDLHVGCLAVRCPVGVFKTTAADEFRADYAEAAVLMLQPLTLVQLPEALCYCTRWRQTWRLAADLESGNPDTSACSSGLLASIVHMMMGLQRAAPSCN